MIGDEAEFEVIAQKERIDRDLDQQEGLKNLDDIAILKAIASRRLTPDELHLLLSALEYSVPTRSKNPKVKKDLVRITGFSKSKIYELWDSIAEKLNPIEMKVATNE